MILVTGATGNVGRPLVEQLVAAGLPVRALSRNPATANLPDGVEVIEGTIDDNDHLDEAFEGVERAFSLTLESNMPRHAENMVKLGKRHGLRQVVLMSSLACEIPGRNFLKDDHYAAEQTYTASGIDWTILRGGVFDANTLWWIHGIKAASVVQNYLRNDAYAPVDPADIAAVAAKVMSSDDYFGKIINLTGPERITPEEQVAAISEALGRKIEFVQLDEAGAQEHFKQYVFPHFGVPGGDEAALALLALLRDPDLPWLEVRPDLEEVLGRKGNTYRDWLAKNIAAFK